MNDTNAATATTGSPDGDEITATDTTVNGISLAIKKEDIDDAIENGATEEDATMSSVVDTQVDVKNEVDNDDDMIASNTVDTPAATLTKAEDKVKLENENINENGVTSPMKVDDSSDDDDDDDDDNDNDNNNDNDKDDSKLLSEIPTSKSLSFLSTRIRNAISKIHTSPYTDIEAWNAIFHECTLLFQTCLESRGVQKRLIWNFIEGCYGKLFIYFPYSTKHKIDLLLMLYKLSLLDGEDDILTTSSNQDNVTNVILNDNLFIIDTIRIDEDDILLNNEQTIAELKMERVFREILGIKDHVNQHVNDKSPATAQDNASTLQDNINAPIHNINATTLHTQAQAQEYNPWTSGNAHPLLGGMCSCNIDIWIIYIQKRIRDAKRIYFASSSQEQDKLNTLRNSITSSYELSLYYVGYQIKSNILWKSYLNYVQSWSSFTSSTQKEPNNIETHQLQQTINQKLRSIYQRIIITPMYNIEEFYKYYENFEKALSEALATAIINEYQPKYQHAKHIFLERLKYPISIRDKIIILPAPPSKDIPKEVTMWKRRIYYERTNPERFTNGKEYILRIRSYYKECIISTCMYYPEIWYDWSQFELSSDIHHRDTKRSIAILQLSLFHIPKCVFLCQALCDLYENLDKVTLFRQEKKEICKGYNASIYTWELFLNKYPCSFGYVSLMRLVRKYCGINPARDVFRKARIILSGDDTLATSASTATTDLDDKDTTTVSTTTASSKSNCIIQTNANANTLQNNTITKNNNDNKTNATTKTKKENKITWHIYATHAYIEQYINNLPEIAVRVYELGIKKHTHFLSIPNYIIPYAELLLSLNKKSDVRCLLLRSIASFENINVESSSNSSASTANIKPIWNLLYKLENISYLSTKSTSATTIKDIEISRYKSLYDNKVADNVLTGSKETFDGIPKSFLDIVHVGSNKNNAQNTTTNTNVGSIDLDDPLSSCNTFGLGKFLERLEIIGLLPTSSSSAGTAGASLAQDETNDLVIHASSTTDESFIQRYRTHRNQFLSGTLNSSNNTSTLHSASNATTSNTATNAEDVTAIDRSKAARERILAAGGGNVQNKQQLLLNIPDWLKPLMIILPNIPIKNKNNHNMNNNQYLKPPPHLIEMALALLRSTTLPNKDTIIDKSLSGGTKRKRFDNNDGSTNTMSLNNNYDSSDDDDANNDNKPKISQMSETRNINSTAAVSSGYSQQFKARQKARMLNTTQSLSAASAIDNDNTNGMEE